MPSRLIKLFQEEIQPQDDLIQTIPAYTETVCNVGVAPSSTNPDPDNPEITQVDPNSPGTYGATYVEINGQLFEVSGNQVTPVPPGATTTYCRTTTVPESEISVPRPDLLVSRPDVGWTGAALSDAFIVENGEYSFTVPAVNTGVVTGLNQYNGRNEEGYFDIDFGFLFNDGNASIIENNLGVKAIGTFVDSDVWTVRRVNRVILYFRNNILIYQSERDGGTDVLYADASLYFSGDTINDAAINLNVIDEVFAASVSFDSTSTLSVGYVTIGDEVKYPLVELNSTSGMNEIRIAIFDVQTINSVSGLSVTENPSTGNASILPSLQGFASEEDTAQGLALLAPLQTFGIDNAIEIDTSYSVSVLSPLSSHGISITSGVVEDTTQELLAIQSFGADDDYAESYNELAPIQAFAGTYPDRLVGAARLVDQITGAQGSSILLWTGRHILTAAHVAEKWTNFNAVDIDFISDTGVTFPTYKPYRVTIHPDRNPVRDANGVPISSFINDLAIVEIADYVNPFVRRHFLYTDEDELGQVFEKTSYSPRVDPNTGAVSAAGWDTINNQFDLVEQGYLRFDFDNGQSINDFFSGTGTTVPNEGFVSPGDSGGASLIDGKIAGISSFIQGFTTPPDVLPGTQGTYGEVATDIRVSAYDNWITANSNVTSPVTGTDPAIPGFTIQLRPEFSAIEIELFGLAIQATASPRVSASIDILLPGLAIEIFSGSRIDIALPALRIDSTASHSVAAQVDIVLPGLEVEATGQMGSVAHMDLILPVGLSIEAYGGSQIALALPGLEIEAAAITYGRALIDINLPGLTIDSRGDNASRASAIDIALPGLEFISSRISLSLPGLAIYAGQPVYSDIALTDDVGTAYAFNVLHGETTRYTQYDFNQIVRLNGLYYGVKADGLYLLEGDKDEDRDIEARFKTADMDFGTALHKRVPYTYLDTTDKTLITTFADNREMCTYQSSFNGRRTRLARGAKGRFWAFEVANINGSPLDLRALEFYPNILSRKV